MKKILSSLFLLTYMSFASADYLDGKSAYEVSDYETALVEFQGALTDGDQESKANALFHLGWMYENGLGTEVNLEAALNYYQQAAELGQNEAQFALGYAYNVGELGLEPSAKESLKWYARSVNEGGNKDASYNLGVAYLNGIGQEVKPNPELARTWLHVGVDLGSVESIYALSAIYYEGNGVEKDTVKAMSLLKQGVLMGHGQAAFYLAQLYEKETPLTSKQKKLAYYYYVKAQDLNYSSANLLNKIDNLILSMDEEDIQDIQNKIQQEKNPQPKENASAEDQAS